MLESGETSCRISQLESELLQEREMRRHQTEESSRNVESKQRQVDSLKKELEVGVREFVDRMVIMMFSCIL